MCGIAGIVSKKTIRSRTWLQDASNLMAHRGPDDYGEWWSSSDNVGFAHRRLSIIDLSVAGRQPMTDFTITFNGEIYNYLSLKKELIKLEHEFLTNSDTEVIIAAYKQWGFDCINHLTGMFAFAIFDKIKNIVFLTRDRIGEKPLHYSFDNDIFYFSSELKPLLSISENNKQINNNSFNTYLSTGYISGENTLLNRIKKLPPAYAIKYDLKSGNFEKWRYWNLPQKIRNSESYDNVNSVKKQLQADVPVGVLLSGGLDSSIITAMAAKFAKDLKTFTIRFPSNGEFDETEHARLISKYFNTEHIELDVQDTGPEFLMELSEIIDEPIIDSSIIPTFLVSKLVRNHCKVVLGGDGGDELFGGYRYYSRLLWMQNNTRFIPQIFLKYFAVFANEMLPLGYKGRNWIRNLDLDFLNDIPSVNNFYDSRSRSNLLPSSIYSQSINSHFNQEETINYGLLNKITRLDLYNFLPEDILVKVDRASMHHSLEVRAPFLDHELVEFVFSKIPSHLKANSTDKKILLKMIAKRLLPEDFDYSRKQGFSPPMNDWFLRKSWIDMTADILLDQNCVFNKTAVQNLLKSLKKGHNNGERIFGLLMFELWRRRNHLSF